MQTKFWVRQAISQLSAVTLILGLLSIWCNDPARLATAFGVMSAGLAFALQQVVTAFASYFVILRGATFTIGDRISMGGVRGDVMRLGFIQTTLMEMGRPPSVQAADPAMTVRFLIGTHSVRGAKDAISRDLVERFDAEGIGNRLGHLRHRRSSADRTAPGAGGCLGRRSTKSSPFSPTGSGSFPR